MHDIATAKNYEDWSRIC